jgi:hypothetical protein
VIENATLLWSGEMGVELPHAARRPGRRTAVTIRAARGRMAVRISTV